MIKKQLIDELIESGYLKTPAIIGAFNAVDRVDFVSPEYRDAAYENYPLPIGSGQTISQPLTVAFMLELLNPKAGEKILDVGFGSGWTTALLAHLVGEKGKVYGLEINPDIFAFGRKNLRKLNFKSIDLRLGSGWEGLSDEAPFDRILVSASAEKIPEKLVSQLKVGGRMVISVGQSVIAVDKTSEKNYKTKEYPGFVFVPLVKDKNKEL